MFGGCKTCQGVTGALFLIVGILLLLRDLNIWGFWNIQAFTALFVIIGIVVLAKRSCASCQAMSGKMK